MKDNNKENQVNIELSEEVSSGVYSNLSIITHSPSEFVVDFVQLMPGLPKGKVKSRIIMTPHNAKRLLKAMQDNISKYEKNFGIINDVEPPTNTPLSFGTPTTQA